MKERKRLYDRVLAKERKKDHLQIVLESVRKTKQKVKFNRMFF